MTTVVNNPAPNNDSGGPMVMIIVLVVLVVFGYIAFVYGVPALQRIQAPGNIEVTVPDKIDVNINQGE